jgi:hypothetical protein
MKLGKTQKNSKNNCLTILIPNARIVKIPVMTAITVISKPYAKEYFVMSLASRIESINVA